MHVFSDCSKICSTSNVCIDFTREEVRMDMVEAQCEVYLTFPFHLQGRRVVRAHAPT